MGGKRHKMAGLLLCDPWYVPPLAGSSYNSHPVFQIRQARSLTDCRGSSCVTPTLTRILFNPVGRMKEASSMPISPPAKCSFKANQVLESEATSRRALHITRAILNTGGGAGGGGRGGRMGGDGTGKQKFGRAPAQHSGRPGYHLTQNFYSRSE